MSESYAARNSFHQLRKSIQMRLNPSKLKNKSTSLLKVENRL